MYRTGRPQLRRPNTVRFNTKGIKDAVTPEQVYAAVRKDLKKTETMKCIAELENKWYNVTFDNERDCERLATYGIVLNGMLIQCERASLINSVVVYVKAPYELSDQAVVSALSAYGSVENIKRQYHSFDHSIETGVRSCLIKNLMRPVPSYIKLGSFSLPVRHKGQARTCRICEATDHLARDCPVRGRCFVCGEYGHRAAWHDNEDVYRDNSAVDSEEEHVDTSTRQIFPNDDRREMDFPILRIPSDNDQSETDSTVSHNIDVDGPWSDSDPALEHFTPKYDLPSHILRDGKRCKRKDRDSGDDEGKQEGESFRKQTKEEEEEMEQLSEPPQSQTQTNEQSLGLPQSSQQTELQTSQEMASQHSQQNDPQPCQRTDTQTDVQPTSDEDGPQPSQQTNPQTYKQAVLQTSPMSIPLTSQPSAVPQPVLQISPHGEPPTDGQTEPHTSQQTVSQIDQQSDDHPIETQPVSETTASETSQQTRMQTSPETLVQTHQQTNLLTALQITQQTGTQIGQSTASQIPQPVDDHEANLPTDVVPSSQQTDSEENEGWVRYVRGGVERLRKKRTSWERKDKGSSNQAHKGRGRNINY